MTVQLYIIRGSDGHPEAIHQRTDRGPKNKAFAWWSLGPDGQAVDNLQGRPVATLPLFGSQHVGKWDTSRPVFLVEGEKAMLALARADQRALGTLGSATPGDAALAVLIGLDLILWPDADEAGRRVMLNIARIVKPAVLSLRWAEWAEAPAGGDAADYLASGLKIEDLPLGPVPKPALAAIIPIASRRRKAARLTFTRSPIETFNGAVAVSDVLARDFPPQDPKWRARAGRTVPCPFHKDEHPSLSILKDDKRVYCFAGSCWAHNDGRGRDAWDLAHAAIGQVAR